MVKKILIFALVIVCGISASGGQALGDPGISDKINAFSLDLYRKLSGEPGNMFFSPYSVYTALAMTYPGARGETARQMGKTLHFGPATGQDQKEIGQLFSRLNAPKESYKLAVANALWGQKGYKILPQYLATLKDNYRAEMNQLDFRRDPEKARKTINRWVEKQTNNKIKELLVPGSVDDQIRLILTNAIYFQAAWAEQFRKEATRDEPFFLTKDKKIVVPMMKRSDEYKYYENGKLQLLRLPYRHYDLEMLVILPKEIAGLGGLERDLKASDLDRWNQEMGFREVIVSLPKFKTTSSFSLKEVLPALGMKDAFSAEKADLSGMTGKRDLFVSDVVHKAFVDVNEEGTEAAAATAVIMAKATALAPEGPKIFKADHPFMFLIREEKSGTILFIGRIMDPRS